MGLSAIQWFRVWGFGVWGLGGLGFGAGVENEMSTTLSFRVLVAGEVFPT